MTQTLTDLRVLVTGATSGIGRALALRLAKDGARLAACGRSEAKLAALAEALAAGSAAQLSNDSEPKAAKADRGHLLRAFCLSAEEEIVQFVADAEHALGRLDVLVNCAGLNSARATVAEMKTADLDWMYTVNVRAPMIFMREVFRRMQPRGRGRIVNVLSTTCLFGNEGLAAYTASKAACDGLTGVFRKEARAAGIGVTAVYPGGVNTPFRAQPRPEYMAAETVAEAVAALLALPGDAVVHELVLRPMAEGNFA